MDYRYDRRVLDHRMEVMKGFKYLPLFYLIPDEIALKRGLSGFPRDPYAAAMDAYWREVYNSKWFQVTVLDTWGWMMWQCLGIRGGVDNYSKNDPFVIMTFSLPMWAALLAEQGINTDFLAAQPPDTKIPFLNMEMAAHNCGQIAKLFWNHPELKMREVWKIVKAHRDHNDYSGSPSHVKMDFHRKFYHTRARIKVESIINADGEFIHAPYTQGDFDEVLTRIWFDGFLKRLNDKDREIIRLLEEGYTQEEIADKLGYANHSGVSKRVKYLRKEFDKFREER